MADYFILMHLKNVDIRDLFHQPKMFRIKFFVSRTRGPEPV